MKKSRQQEIAEARREAGLTQKQLAEKCGYGEQTIRNAETSSKEPSDRLFKSVMDALKKNEAPVISTSSPAIIDMAAGVTADLRHDLCRIAIAEMLTEIPQDRLPAILRRIEQLNREDKRQRDSGSKSASGAS